MYIHTNVHTDIHLRDNFNITQTWLDAALTCTFGPICMLPLLNKIVAWTCPELPRAADLADPAVIYKDVYKRF